MEACIHILLLINDSSAVVAANLALIPRQGLDVPHLHHRNRKGSCKSFIVIAKSGDQLPGYGAVEELLIRVKEPFTSYYIPEIHGVGEGRRGVQREQIGVATASLRWADGLQLSAELGVDVAVVVDVGAEAGALRQPQSVAAGEDDEVVDVQPLILEVGDQLRKVKEWRWDVVVRRSYVGERGVTPP